LGGALPDSIESVSDVVDWLKTLRKFDEVAVTAACGLFLLFEKWGWIPPLPAWIVGLAWFGFLRLGCVLAVKLVSVVALIIQVLILWIKRDRT
jgi:hypothetical protein